MDDLITSENASMFRVVPNRGDDWGGDKLAIICGDGRIAEMSWIELDKLVKIELYDSGQDLQDITYEMSDDNPLEEMYRTSGLAHTDFLFEFEDDEFSEDWGEW